MSALLCHTLCSMPWLHAVGMRMLPVGRGRCCVLMAAHAHMRIISTIVSHISTLLRAPTFCRLVQKTSAWSNKKEELAAEQGNCEQLVASLAEVDEEGMRAKVKQASEERDAASAALNRCGLCRWAASCRCWAGCLHTPGGQLLGRRECSWSATLLFRLLTPPTNALPHPPTLSLPARSAELAVQAAQNELAGAEAGDGRDASNRSLQERLADAQNAQVGRGLGRNSCCCCRWWEKENVLLDDAMLLCLPRCTRSTFAAAESRPSFLPASPPAQTEAEAEAKAADTRCKHLTKQLAEQRKALASKQKEVRSGLPGGLAIA